jgi:predicted dehydrogenase
LELKAVYSRSLKSAKDVAEAAGAQQNPVELYSEDSEQKWDDILKREDIQAVYIR